MKKYICPILAGVALMLFSGCASGTKQADNSAPMASFTAPAQPAAAPAASPTPPMSSMPMSPAASAPVSDTNAIKLTVVKVDSEETSAEDGKGANAVDGDPNTFWHTQWQDANPEPPHEIIIELTPPATIKGFTYLPRQDDSENGTIKDYEFYVSDDGTNFGQPVAKGSFEDTKDKKTVTFAPTHCQFIELKALSEVNGEAWTSAAEIGVVPNN